ncbi:hypothetical protein BASA81_003770 [Batrachochytrium salamandrivorans]|nr:hypothetical protein BASA81_003770 [Batrachochytrium salamandrivorans]
MEFVFRRISNALKFKEDEFMKALYAECQLKISSAQPQDPVCFALLLDLAGNVLANELSVEDDLERTKQLRKMITETFHAKQMAVRNLESTMSRADFSSLKTEVLSCIIDELIPLRGNGKVHENEGEELSVEEMFRKKDKEIQNANALVIEMENRMKQEWETLKGETASIIADMQLVHSQQVETLQVEAERSMKWEIEQSANREREWVLMLEKREIERAALEQKQYQQQEWALEQQEAKWKRMLATQTQDLASERANMERQMEFNSKLQLEEVKQQMANEFDQWKLEHIALENQQYLEWKQEYIDEQEDLYSRWKQEFLDEQEQTNAQWKEAFLLQQEEANLRRTNEQAESNFSWKQQQEELQESWKRGFVAQQDEQNDLWKQEWILTRTSELKREWDAEHEEWKLEMVEKAREIKQKYLDEQERANAEWKQQLEADLGRNYETQLASSREECYNQTLVESQLRNELANVQQELQSCREQFELDEILIKEQTDGLLASARQQSVLDKVSAIEAALKHQRVQFEEERAKTVSKLCAGEPPQTPQPLSNVPPLLVVAPVVKQADLRRLLEEAQTVHRQLEAITFTLRNAKPISPTTSQDSSPPRRLTQVSSFHTPLDKRKPKAAKEEEPASTTTEAEKLEAKLMDEVVLGSETSSLSTVLQSDSDKPDMSEVDLY